MKSIEERANEYIAHSQPKMNSCPVELKRAFISGAKSEYIELTKWNSPNEHPTDNHYVLGKFDGNRIFRVIYYDDLWKEWRLTGTHEITWIVGWREIHE